MIGTGLDSWPADCNTKPRPCARPCASCLQLRSPSWSTTFCKPIVLLEQGQPVDLEAFSNHLANNYIPNTVIVDCTASSEWLGAGLRCLHVGSSALSDRPRPAAPPVSVLPLVQLAIGRPADWFGAPHVPASQTSLASGTWSGCARASTSSPPTRSSTGTPFWA